MKTERVSYPFSIPRPLWDKLVLWTRRHERESYAEQIRRYIEEGVERDEAERQRQRQMRKAFKL